MKKQLSIINHCIRCCRNDTGLAEQVHFAEKELCQKLREDLCFHCIVWAFVQVFIHIEW